MEMTLRLCDENDIDVIYKLANDPTVRDNAFSSNRIHYKDHCEWYAEGLIDENRIMYIVEKDNVIIGQIRLDKQKDKAIISYSIEKNNRRKGYGRKVLELIKKEAILNGIVILEGLVKKNNIASRKAFTSNRFIESEEDTYFKYIYLLKSGDNIEVGKDSK